MDGRRFIDSIFASEKARPITQVVMNLPNDAAEFLGTQSFDNFNLKGLIYYWMLLVLVLLGKSSILSTNNVV